MKDCIGSTDYGWGVRLPAVARQACLAQQAGITDSLNDYIGSTDYGLFAGLFRIKACLLEAWITDGEVRPQAKGPIRNLNIDIQ